MSQFPWQPAYMRVQSMGGDSEIDALQTDVMRFMAILGLCLMAIFSLVQSMPYQAAQKTPQLESKALLQAEVRQLQASVTGLLEKVNQLEASLQQQTAQIEQQMTDQKMRLLELDENLDRNQQNLAQVRKQLLKEQRLHQQQQAKYESFVQRKPQAKKQAKPEQKKGFSLRFASDQALLSLLSQKKLSLSVLMANHAWNIRQQGINWKVTPANLPQQYYQMSAQTVPGVLRQSVQQQLSVHKQSQVIWAVALPDSIKATIKRLMQEQQGGELIISATAEVQLQ